MSNQTIYAASQTEMKVLGAISDIRVTAAFLVTGEVLLLGIDFLSAHDGQWNFRDGKQFRMRPRDATTTARSMTQIGARVTIPHLHLPIKKCLMEMNDV